MLGEGAGAAKAPAQAMGVCGEAARRKSTSVGRARGNCLSSLLYTRVAVGRLDVMKDVRDGLQMGAWQ